MGMAATPLTSTDGFGVQSEGNQRIPLLLLLRLTVSPRNMALHDVESISPG